GGERVDPELFSLHLPKPDWGDLWHSVRNEAADLTNVAVAAWNSVESAVGDVVDSIEATIQTVIDNVLQPIVSYVVDTVQQVFDLAEGVFQALAADFETLYRWLGSLFDWDAIKATHESLVQILNSVIYTQIPNSLSELNAKIDDFFESFSTSGISFGSEGNQSLGDAQSSALSQANQAPGPSSNWLQNQVLDAGGGDPAADPTVDGPADDSPLVAFEQAVVDELGGLWDTVVEQFQAAILEGQSAEDLTPNQVLSLVTQMIENDLLAACQTVTDLAFDFAEFVVQSVGDVANTPWHIPLISKVYKQEVGSELSLLDLTALVIAMPASVAMRAAGLDVSALQAAARNIDVLVTHLTPAQMLGREPIDAATRDRLLEAGLDDSEDTLTLISQALGVVYSFALLVLSPFAMLYATKEIKNKWINAIPVVLTLAVLAFSFPLWTGLPSTSYDWISIACWSVFFLLWFGCTAVPAISEFLPKKPADPERQPTLPKNLPATTPVMDWVTGVFGLVGGLILMGGYTAQAFVEGQSPDYAPDDPERGVDIGLKWVQNVLTTLPVTTNVLGVNAFDQWGGKGWAGLLAVSGYAGGGVSSLIRVGINLDDGQVHHVT
ncbi:MAG: hypothetical protein AAFX50_01585, partial [Acidobacteriota bacterium]